MRVLFALPRSQAPDLGKWSLFLGSCKDQEGRRWCWGNFWQRPSPPCCSSEVLGLEARPFVPSWEHSCGGDLWTPLWGAAQPCSPGSRDESVPSFAPQHQLCRFTAVFCTGPAGPYLSLCAAQPSCPESLPPSSHVPFKAPLEHHHLSAAHPDSLPSRDRRSLLCCLCFYFKVLLHVT